MKLLSSIAVGAALFLGLVMPTSASAADETAEASFTIRPLSGAAFFSNAFSPAEGRVDTVISLPGPPEQYPKITPLKVADLKLASSSLLTFNPKPSMPVCPDEKLGPPPTTNSIPVPEMIARCPRALIGNGTAMFALAKNSRPSAAREGDLLIFNGGRIEGLPKIKVYSYSYDLQTGIYTSAVLQPDGGLRFEIPPLPVDSAVTAISLSIPGRKMVRPKPEQGITVTLPAGLDRTYVQARCPAVGGFPWSADHILGERDTGGNPINDPDLVVSDSGTVPCSGVVARPELGKMTVAGPASVIRGRPASYRVTVRNVGTRSTSGGRLTITGRGVSASLPVGSIPAGEKRALRIGARFQLRGKVEAKIRLTTRDAGSAEKVKRIEVRVR
jgi:hypothetical protein